MTMLAYAWGTTPDVVERQSLATITAMHEVLTAVAIERKAGR